MYIKLIQPNKDGSRIYQNTSSAKQVVNYLHHESREKPEGTKLFFSYDRSDVDYQEVLRAIDENGKTIGNEKEKFYSIIISPAEEELVHVDNNDTKLKDYARQVMENYAANFQLKDGKQITSKDLVWFAAIHSDREIKPIDLKQHRLLSVKEAQQIKLLLGSTNPSDKQEASKILEKAQEREMHRYNPVQFSAGSKKPGFHKHIHILVSSMDVSQTYRLNPRTRQTIFSIRRFQETCARDFKRMFGYKGETLSKGFYQKHSQQDQEFFNEKIAKTTDQINHHLSSEKLDDERLKEIGKECCYSKAFFINLTKLKYRFNQGNYTHDPYFFVKHGKEQKLEDYYSKLSGGTEDKDKTSDVNINSQQEQKTNSGIKGDEVSVERMLQFLGSIRSGQMAIEETFMLDEEPKKIRKYQEKGRGGDNIEMS